MERKFFGLCTRDIPFFAFLSLFHLRVTHDRKVEA